ncbi:hypothetical protein [Bacillus sp. FJAT-52991]|uniref:Uncharacterized protein n=1 Tax=Bacillus kandeliae TaxID=3129297 RepID=A0ABZ2NA50_9BACI
MGVLNEILSAIKNISLFSEITEWKETDKDLFIKYQCNTTDAKTLFTSNWLDLHMQEQHYIITLRHNGHMITYTNYRSMAPFLDDGISSEIDLIFDKNIIDRGKNVLIYFSMKSFLDKLKQKELDFFNVDHMKKFVFLPISNSVDNGLLKLVPLESFDEEEFNIPLDEPVLEQATTVLNLYTDMHSDDNSPLPLTFAFNKVEHPDLQDTLNFIVVYLTTKFLANKYHDKKFTFKGYQRIELLLDDFFKPEHYQDFLQLFKFTYDEHKYDDKIEIVRNVITLYLSDLDDLQKFDSVLPKIRGTIEANFSAYIQKQIKEFFDQRKEVVKEAYNASVEAKSEADKIINSINQSLLGLITASLLGVLAYSKGDKFLFILALSFHIVYFIISYFVNMSNFRSKESDIEHNFNLYVEQFSVLKEDELSTIKQNYLTSALKKLSNRLSLYTGVTIIIVMIMLAAIGIGYDFIKKSQPTDNVNNTKISQEHKMK